MAKITWMFGVMCAVHNAESFLPFFGKVKARTRWCLSEGSHCPVNLPFSACCKPYVCTDVPKIRKPTFLLNSSNYTDHRCLLPSSNLSSTEKPVKDETHINTELPEENTNVEITTVQFQKCGNESCLNSKGNKVNYESTGSALNETNNSNGVSNPYFENETSSEINSSSESKNNNYSSESESLSFENSNTTSSESSSESFKDPNLSENIKENNDKSSNHYLHKSSLQLKHDSNDTGSYLEPGTALPTTLIPNKIANVTDVTEEDWTSSEMNYDTRPSLHKIVTVIPFRLFKTVELIKLNESMETSE